MSYSFRLIQVLNPYVFLPNSLPRQLTVDLVGASAVPFVILPLSHVRLGHVGVQHLVLDDEAGLAPLGHDGGARVVRLARHPRRGGAR